MASSSVAPKAATSRRRRRCARRRPRAADSVRRLRVRVACGASIALVRRAARRRWGGQLQGGRLRRTSAARLARNAGSAVRRPREGDRLEIQPIECLGCEPRHLDPSARIDRLPSEPTSSAPAPASRETSIRLEAPPVSQAKFQCARISTPPAPAAAAAAGQAGNLAVDFRSCRHVMRPSPARPDEVAIPIRLHGTPTVAFSSRSRYQIGVVAQTCRWLGMLRIRSPVDIIVGGRPDRGVDTRRALTRDNGRAGHDLA